MSKNSYALEKVGRDFDAIHSGHVALALSRGWSPERARREFSRLQARRDAKEAAQQDQWMTRQATDPREIKIRRMARNDVPGWLVEKAITEGWSVKTAGKLFIDALRQRGEVS